MRGRCAGPRRRGGGAVWSAEGRLGAALPCAEEAEAVEELVGEVVNEPQTAES